MKRPNIQSLKALVSEINRLEQDNADAAEYYTAIEEYYKPIEDAAKNLLSFAGYRADSSHVQVSQNTFDALAKAVGWKTKGEEK